MGTEHARTLLDEAVAKCEGKPAVGIDLGCGTGILGLALLRAGGAAGLDKVVFTDVGASMALAQTNLSANPASGSKAEATVAELWWGNGTEATVLETDLPLAVVAASDVVYDEAQIEPLVKTMSALAGPDTLCLLGFRNRTSAQVIRKFFDLLKAEGFESETIESEHLNQQYRAGDAHVLWLIKSA